MIRVYMMLINCYTSIHFEIAGSTSTLLGSIVPKYRTFHIIAGGTELDFPSDPFYIVPGNQLTQAMPMRHKRLTKI